MSYIISGIQQIGIGVTSVETAWEWYRRAFGMDVPVFQEAAEAPFMTRYTGGKVESRNAVLAINLAGGGGFEIWQYTSRTPVGPAREPRLGDIGIFAGVMK
ncbi:MAG: VOC family protein, partial [Spirochaetota bacterium]